MTMLTATSVVSLKKSYILKHHKITTTFYFEHYREKKGGKREEKIMEKEIHNIKIRIIS